jgi:hypothetical protein
MTDEWCIGKDVEWGDRGLIHGTTLGCLEGLRKTTKNLGKDSRFPGRDVNPAPPEYEAGVLSTWP